LFGVDEAGLAMEAFVTLELVGQGSFGKVYKGRRRGTAEIVALKFIPKRSRTTKELQVSEDKCKFVLAACAAPWKW
jgi:serine/threonine protein kinase